MPKRLPLLTFTLLALAGCNAAPRGLAVSVAQAPVNAKASGVVRVTPSFKDGGVRKLLADVVPHTQASINHLVIALRTVTAGPTETLVAQTDLVAADLLDPVTFTNLKNDTTYRVRAFAYKTADTSQKISVDATSFVDIVVGTDDAPALANLVVTLTDVTFAGSTTSDGLTITPGNLAHSGNETVSVNL